MLDDVIKITFAINKKQYDSLPKGLERVLDLLESSHWETVVFDKMTRQPSFLQK